MPKPKSPSEPTAVTRKDSYLHMPGSNSQGFLSKYQSSVEKFSGVITSSTNLTRFTDNIDIRPQFTPKDYYDQRPAERIPDKIEDIIRACRSAYYNVGVVRNVIDLMTDFVIEDFTVMHPDKATEIWFRTYYKKIKFNQYAEEFVRHFLLDANVIPKRITAKLTKPVENDMKTVSMAKPDVKMYKDTPDIEKNEIPWRYIFLDPTTLKWIGGEAARIADKRALSFAIPRKIISTIKNPSNKLEKDIVDNIPADIRDMIKAGKTTINLDMSKIYIAHNKKDSWQDWGMPYLKSILKDLIFKDKLRLAEMSALDGVINVVRLWKLGDHEQRIFPGEGAIERLIDILTANVGGGTLDIVWDDMISMEAFYPPIKDILGSEKYTEVDHDILIGLGIPEVLLGGKGANFSNSFIQLKTLVERLEAAREAVLDWIRNEVTIICKARGYKIPPVIRFKHMNLQDENVTRQLILGLFDRGILSPETALEYFGEHLEIEVARNSEQRKEFKSKGLEILSPFAKKEEAKPTSGGRPPNTKDAGRKSRNPKPRTKAGLTLYALEAVEKINETVTSEYIQKSGIKNARQLSDEQKTHIQNVRLGILSCIKPMEKLSPDVILATNYQNSDKTPQLVQNYNDLISDFMAKNNEQPTFAELKKIEALAWVELQGDNENG